MENRQRDIKIARAIKANIKQKLGDRLISVVLYGSRANGTADSNSDLDLFLLMKNRPRYGSRNEDVIIDAADEGLSKYGVVVSPVVYGKKMYREQKNLSFMKEVQRGIKV